MPIHSRCLPSIYILKFYRHPALKRNLMNKYKSSMGAYLIDIHVNN